MQNGFVALPVRELSPEWHASFAESLSEHFFGGGVERLPGRHLVQDAALSELCNTPTVRGALTSILGPEDQNYVPVRHHFPRWAMIFYVCLSSSWLLRPLRQRRWPYLNWCPRCSTL